MASICALLFDELWIGKSQVWEKETGKIPVPESNGG